MLSSRFTIGATCIQDDLQLVFRQSDRVHCSMVLTSSVTTVLREHSQAFRESARSQQQAT